MPRLHGRNSTATNFHLLRYPIARKHLQIVDPLGVERSAGACPETFYLASKPLRLRKDVFRAFLYASRTSKIHRLITAGILQEKAITDVDTIDKDRAAFIKRYFKLNWPEIHLYDAMFNTETGDSFVAEMLARCIQEVARRTSVLPEFTDAGLTI
jgi:hypothetical protein